MRIRTTRREFMRYGAAGAALLAGRLRGVAQVPGPIVVEQSAGTKRFAKEADLRWRAEAGRSGEGSGSPGGMEIVVDPSRMYQEVLGFGAAMTDAATYMISQLSAEARERFLHELFDPGELGMNVTRTCVGASDFSREVFSYDEGEPDPELARFSIERDRQYLIPQLVTARRIRPELFILASPWSPPGWMKNGGSMLGGDMKPKNFAAYARYLMKYLQAYEAAGVHIDALTSQNESDTEQAERMPACAWAQEHEVIFISKHLGPQLKAAKLETKIWLLDHNFNLWGRVFNTLEDPDVFQYVDGVAWHPYVGSVTAVTRIHDAYPSKGNYWTEGQFATTIRAAKTRTAATPGPMTAATTGQEDSGTMDLSGLHREVAEDVAIAQGGTGGAMALRNWVRCVIDWNVALDENGNPNLGPFVHSKGTVTIDSKTKEITRHPNYWAIKHYNHAARRGARVVSSEGEMDGVAHVAFLNPDGRKCLVLSNTGAARAVTVRVPGAMAEVRVPGNSVTNLSWS